MFLPPFRSAPTRDVPRRPAARARARWLVLLAALAVAPLAACGASDDAATTPDSGALFSCATETRAVAYAPHLTRPTASGAFEVELVQSAPPPPARGSESWTVRVVDAAGAPQDGLTLTVSPFMPDHNHGTSVKAVITPTGAGTYTIAPLYLYMAGYWEVTVNVQSATSGKDPVVFPVCISG
jgi:hypothetical protein